MVRRVPNRRDRRPQENGGPKNKRARRSTSDQEDESNSEDEEREEVVMNEQNKQANGKLESAPTVKQEEDLPEEVDPSKSRDTEKGVGLTNGVTVKVEEEHTNERCHSNGDVTKEAVDVQTATKPYSESTKPYAETPSQTGQGSATTSATDADHKPAVQSESTQPAVDAPPPQPVKRKCTSN